MNSLVSIIVPVFNTAPYLAGCLESIIDQSYRNIEIILINDGSTDLSGEICDQHARSDARIVVIHQPNLGVSTARNVGLNIANGDYITFSDSDDLMDSDMVELLLRNASERDADISACGLRITSAKGVIQYEYGTNELYIWNRQEAIKRLLNNDMLSEGIPVKLYKRNIIDGIRFDETRRINEDVFFLFQSLLRSDRIVFSDVCKYHYINRMGSSSLSKFSEKYFDILFFSDQIIDTITASYPSLTIDAHIRDFRASLYLLRRIALDEVGISSFAQQWWMLRERLNRYPNLGHILLVIPMKFKLEYLMIRHTPKLYLKSINVLIRALHKTTY